MKGLIQPDHMPVNKFELLVVGLPTITFISVSGIEEELNTVDLPDRTKASGGRTNPVEFTVSVPMHHTVDIAAMEAWFREGQDPVSPTYRKPATLIYKSLSGENRRTFTLVEVFVMSRSTPDAELENDGEMAVQEFKMSCNDILPA